jgi:DNA polymerase I-like protein with 3'-5' exonuclease and polymerase domains
VLHVHDEIVIECANEAGEAVAEVLDTVMCTAPKWAKGFPLKTGVKIMSRYGK